MHMHMYIAVSLCSVVLGLTLKRHKSYRVFSQIRCAQVQPLQGGWWLMAVLDGGGR